MKIETIALPSYLKPPLLNRLSVITRAFRWSSVFFVIQKPSISKVRPIHHLWRTEFATHINVADLDSR
jgi:hypothetical protein